MNGSRQLRVLLVDDHDIVHWGIKLLLCRQPWVERCVTAHDPAEALDMTRRYEPNVALVDVFLGADAGTLVAADIRKASPMTHVLLISGTARLSEATVQAAGAAGFIGKHLPAEDIVNSVRMVGMGMKVTTASPTARTTPGGLSARELEVLRLLASGSTVTEIAGQLYLSVYTIKDHTKSIYRKVGARNRADAVLRAERLGLLT